MKKLLASLLGIFLILGITGIASAVSIDLLSWNELTLDLTGGQNAGNWDLSNANTTVTQTINADPSFYLN